MLFHDFLPCRIVWLSSRQLPLPLPYNRGGQRFANSCDSERVVSLNASELPGATGPLVSARDDLGRTAFSLASEFCRSSEAAVLSALLTGNTVVRTSRFMRMVLSSLRS